MRASLRQGTGTGNEGREDHARPWYAAAPLAFIGVLLAVATGWEGGFQLARWGLPALFTLALLVSFFAAGVRQPTRNRWTGVILTGIWGLAGWALLSMLWSPSPASAWQGGARLLFYAAIVTAPLLLGGGLRVARWVGDALVLGIAALAVITLVRLETDGPALYLAGRLNGPIDYRNATACLFGMGFWPLIVLASPRGGRRLVRALAFAVAVLTLGLAFLTQSRGIAIGLLGGGLVALLLGPDRVRRAWLAILAVAAVALASHWLLTPWRAFDGGEGFVSAGDIGVAATSLGILTVLAFVAGAAIALFDNGLRPSSPRVGPVRRAARAGLVVVVVVGIAGALVAIGDPGRFVNAKVHEFTSDQTTVTTATRLTSVGGQRYDLWRVAWDDFEANPVLGVGQDSYPFSYYRHRATDRNLDNPHSLFFATLAENGIVGVLLLALFFAGLIGAAISGWRSASPGTRRSAVALCSLGVVAVGQTMVDWIWQIPGLMGLGLFAIALGAAQLTGAPVEETVARSPRAVLLRRALPAGALTAAFAAVLLLYLSDAFVRQARAVADTSSPAQLAAARHAAALDPLSVTPHYLEASALETMGFRSAAAAQLRDAARLEPRNFVPLGLLGDLEARAGRIGLAREYYRRASRLDPQDTGLKALATNAPL